MVGAAEAYPVSDPGPVGVRAESAAPQDPQKRLPSGTLLEQAGQRLTGLQPPGGSGVNCGRGDYLTRQDPVEWP